MKIEPLKRLPSLMNPIDALETETWRHRLRNVLSGLKAPKDSGEYKAAIMMVQRTLGPSLAALSVCGIVLILLVTLVTTQALVSESEIEVQVVEAETIELDFEEIEPPPPEPLDDIDTLDEILAPLDGTPMVTTDAEVLTVGTALDTTPVIIAAPMITRSPIVLKNLYGNRTAAGRAAALRRYGGNRRTETAVLKALRWLARVQDQDGSWSSTDSKEPIAMAGLALLSFLAHGETTESEEFGNAVEKAIKYLLSMQRADGLFPGGNAYTHGIATYALTEAYAMSRIMALRENVEYAIDVIIEGQQVGGGFDYNFRQGERVDLSVSGWQIQALKAAQMANITNAAHARAMDKALYYLSDQAWSPENNRFRYGGSGSGSWTMNGVGVLCMQLLGHARHPNTRNGLASMADLTCTWSPNGPNGVYGWYYVTQALFHQGGNAWNQWNRQFSEMLIRNQHEDGYWDGGDHGGGKVYTTTLAVLMLQVYYRYLPTFQTPEETSVETDIVSDHDVVIEIH